MSTSTRRNLGHTAIIEAVLKKFFPAWENQAKQISVRGKSTGRLYETNYALRSNLKLTFKSRWELPDIIAYARDKNWLYLIEAVHSFGPISPTRLRELQKLTKDCTAEIIYVTAFPDRTTFRKFAPQIAWETEVWIAEDPDHLIHFDGQRFLGPYPRPPKET